MHIPIKGQRGAVSLFLVVFSALLITTITIAFVRIMIQDQMQATTNDLSKSALDSAQAGVEDAKRLIVMYQQNCSSGPKTSKDCGTWYDLMDGTHCDALQKAGIVSASDDGVLLQQSEGDKALQQAYTCVKVMLDTPDYVGSLSPGESRLIPLKAVGSFDKVRIEWFSKTDLEAAQAGDTVNLDTSAQLTSYAAWPRNRPSLMRAQLLQFGSDFKMSDFDANGDDDKTDATTLFLMPSTVGLVGSGLNFLNEYSSGPLQQIKCDDSFSATSTDGEEYACSATVKLPLPINADSIDDRTAYLRLNAPYNTSTSFRVSLLNGSKSDTVQFDGVQPEVDSTGRANDLFRRVLSRVELNNNGFPYVEGTLDITGNLCKTFSVSSSAKDYDPGTCKN